jgi:hypothetical protein
MVEEPIRSKVLPDGRFLFDLLGQIDHHTTVRVHFLDAIGSVIAVWRGDLPEGRPKNVDLGLVSLSEPGCVAHGRVLDDLGQPVAAAEVHVSPTSLAMAHADEAERDRMLDLHEFIARSDQTGGFVAYGPIVPRQIRVSARAPGVVPGADETAVNGGAIKVDVFVSRVGAIQGRLLLRKPADARWCEAFVASSSRFPNGQDEPPVLEQGVTFGGEERVEIGSDGGFLLRDVEPGSRAVVVELRTSGGYSPRLVRGVTVVPGRTTMLDPIDVTGSRFPRYVPIVPVDASGFVQSQNAPFEVDRDGRRQGRADRWDNHEILIHDGFNVFDVVVEGYRSRRVEGVDGARLVPLEPGIAVGVEIEMRRSIDGARVVLVPMLDGRTPAAEQGVHALVGADRAAFFRLSDPGWYEVHVFAPPSESTQDEEPWSELPRPDPSTIYVEDDPDPQSFSVQVAES